MSAVWDIEGIDSSECLVLISLADHADDQGRCYPSIARLAKRTKLSGRGVQKVITRLIEKGFVTVSPCAGQGGANLYTVTATPEPRSPLNDVHPRTEFTTPLNHVRKTPEPRSPKPSGTIIEPSEEKEEGARAMPVDLSLVSKLTHALGFDHHGQIPRYWISPDAGLIVARWQTDLGLTPDEIVHVAVGNMRAHNSPANGPKTLTRHMQDFAAAKDAPRLEPTKGSPNVRPSTSPRSHQSGQGQQLSGLAGAAMRRRAAREQGHEG